jgi:hypothetical protein
LVSQETSEPFIQPEGLSESFSKRGLAISIGSPFVEFSAPSESTVGSKTSVFDELRQREKIKLSVSKLFQGENSRYPLAVSIVANLEHRVISSYGVFGGGTWDSGI